MDMSGHDAVMTIWPSEISVVCRPFTDEASRCHIHSNGTSQDDRDAMIGRAVSVCLERGCWSISIREENYDD